MKIAFDAKRAYCNFTGLGNHSRTTLDILTEYFPENEYVLFTPKVKMNDVTRHYLEHPGLKTVQPSGIIKGGLWRTLCLAEEAKKMGAEVFHGLSNELPFGIDKYKSKGNGHPMMSVVTIHDVAFRTFPEMYHWADRQIYDLKWRYACRHADRIIAISEATKQDILHYYDVPEDKITVVYQPVAPYYYGLHDESDAASLKKFCCSTKKEMQRLSKLTASVNPINTTCETISHEQLKSGEGAFMLYVGSINSRKNLLSAVRALALLPESLRIPLVIVGGGREYKREVETYIATQHLEQWCVWLKGVDDDQLHWLYAQARLFVYPSFCEGFGLPVVEARLSGCPVITSNVSSLPEAAGTHALLVDPKDDIAISKAMERLICDDALHAEMADKSRTEALQTLHPKVLAQQLMDVYNKL